MHERMLLTGASNGVTGLGLFLDAANLCGMKHRRSEDGVYSTSRVIASGKQHHNARGCSVCCCSVAIVHTSVPLGLLALPYPAAACRGKKAGNAVVGADTALTLQPTGLGWDTCASCVMSTVMC